MLYWSWLILIFARKKSLLIHVNLCKRGMLDVDVVEHKRTMEYVHYSLPILSQSVFTFAVCDFLIYVLSLQLINCPHSIQNSWIFIIFISFQLDLFISFCVKFDGSMHAQTFEYSRDIPIHPIHVWSVRNVVMTTNGRSHIDMQLNN